MNFSISTIIYPIDTNNVIPAYWCNQDGIDWDHSLSCSVTVETVIKAKLTNVDFGSIIRYKGRNYKVLDTFGTKLYPSKNIYVCHNLNGDVIPLAPDTIVEIVEKAEINNPEYYK